MHIEIYIGIIFAHITTAYNISEHWIGVIVAVIQAVYRLPAKCAGNMGLLWAGRKSKLLVSNFNHLSASSTLQLTVIGFVHIICYYINILLCHHFCQLCDLEIDIRFSI